MWRLRLKSLVIIAALLTVVISPLGMAGSPKAAATPSPSSWVPGRIIDDSVFFNPNTMSSQDIQNFLVSKEGSCSSNCMRDYAQSVPSEAADSYCGAINGGSMSAATIIKVVSAACTMNSQAMLVLLQKENCLVTDPAPCGGSYQTATGFGCPDTSGCDANYFGFFNQVYHAARQFQVYQKNPDIFNFAVGRTSNVQYSPNSSCGSGPVTMQTAATAGLYNYTPYQPNQAALNAGYGTGDSCSAYGNRNFWLFFTDWFGSPIGSEYAWLIQSLTYANGDNILTKGHDEVITLKALNVSRHPWYNHGDYPVRLGTWNPANRSSAIMPTRVDMQESEVDINQVGTFQFHVNPQVEGTFVEALNLVVEGYTWMPWPGFSPTVVVTSNPYQWQVNSVSYSSGTGQMSPGGTQSMVVRVTNTGNATWDKTTPPIWLATWPPDRPSAVATASSGKWPNPTRITQFNESSVPPGGQASFQFDVRVPFSGTFYEQLNMVAEGQNWFNDPGLVLYLRGSSLSWQPVWTSVSTSNYNIPRNTNFTITIRAHNNGEVTWSRGGTYPTRLGTWNPSNRGSALSNPSWLNDIRPTDLVESSVPSGQDGTFTFTARTPSTPGPLNESFNLVDEGLEWSSDPGYSIHINVL